MTKCLIEFEQYLVNQDGKKTNVGKTYIKPDYIIAVVNLWDKSDFIISDVVGIRDKLGQVTGVKGKIEDIVQMIEEALL